MRGTRRQLLGILLAGWLLGLLTAFMWPAVTTERQTVVVTRSGGGPNSTGRVASLANSGWVVSRTDSMGSTPVVQLERARYLGVREELADWWNWLRYMAHF